MPPESTFEHAAFCLDKLLGLLSSLPEYLPCSDGTHYPFLEYTPDPRRVDFTGSRQGALNQVLEHVFGNRHERVSSGQAPVEFSYRVPDLLAVVDVLRSHISGNSSENNLLVKWIEDLIVSAETTIQFANTPHSGIRASDRTRKPNVKRKQGDDEEQARKKRKADQIEASNAEKCAKMRTEDIPNYNPSKLRDEEPLTEARGRKGSSLLSKLGIRCRDDQDRKRVRCSGDGCTQSWSGSRQSRFILPHAKSCRFLSLELREEACTALRELATSVQLAKLEENQIKDSSPNNITTSTSHTELVKRKLAGDNLLVRLVCSQFLRPTLVNSQPFRAYVHHLDPHTKVMNSTTLVKQIHAEAEAALQASIDLLRKQHHLSITFDGATLRRSQSVYTLGALRLPEALISEVYSILNHRFAEVFESSGVDRDVYVTTFLLDYRYLRSKILAKKQANPLSNVVRISTNQSGAFHEPADLRSPLVVGALFDADLRESVAAYQLAGQFLISQLAQEVNSKRTPHIQGLHRTWDALVQSFRIQLIKYCRQLPPFDQHNKDDTPLEYWSLLVDREDASILAYLAIKLFSIATNSIPDERTGSAFTRINSADRSNQNASTVVAMTQVLQQERRNSQNRRKPTLIRFRDIPGLIKSTDRLPAAPLNDTDSESDTNESEASESDDEPAPSNDNDLEGAVDLDEPGEWEIGAGLDEDPEQVSGTDNSTRSRSFFELAQLNGVDLSNPLLRDLLRDTGDEDSNLETNVSTSGNGHTSPFADIYASPTKF